MEWISVKVKSKWPETDKRILLFDGDRVFEGLLAEFSYGCVWCDVEYIENKDVTHWMPLPEAPKEC